MRFIDWGSWWRVTLAQGRHQREYHESHNKRPCKPSALLFQNENAAIQLNLLCPELRVFRTIID
jgi:hypothetical protein